MADVTLTSEQTGYLSWAAYANATDKGSAMSGDGSAGNPYDCIQEALEALAAIGAGNVAVTRQSVSTASRARSALTATIVTSTAHGLAVNDLVSIRGLGGSGYNHEQVTVTSVPDATTFTFMSMGGDEPTTGNSGGTVSRYYLYNVEFLGALATTDIDTLIPFHALSGGITPDLAVTEKQQGTTSTNEIQRIRLNGHPTGGAFRLTFTRLTGNILEVAQAMRWAQEMVATDPVVAGVVPPDRHFLHRIPTGEKWKYPHYIVITPLDTQDTRWIGRTVRSKAANYLLIKVVAPEMQPSERTQRLAQRLSELFDHHINHPIPDGLILSCTRINQSVASEEDAGQTILSLGIVTQINITQNV
jgi:hypothetical protein